MRKQNVDLYTNWVVNKIIDKDVDKIFNKCTRDNLDKSVEFIFDNSEKKKIETKILKKWGIMLKWKY